MSFRMRPAQEYLRTRAEFGRPMSHFKGKGPKIFCDMKPDSDLKSRFIPMDRVCKQTQISPIFSAHEVVTEKTTYKERRDNHEEGGWPKEVNLNDEDMVLRFKKKLERDDNLLRVLPNLFSEMDHCIMQNNALEMYRSYYSEGSWDVIEPPEERKSQLLNTFTDLWAFPRPAVWISFDYEGDKFAVAHAILEYQTEAEDSYSYVWDFENPAKPVLPLDARVPCCVLEYNTRNINLIIGGLVNGQLVLFDIRRGSRPVERSLPSVSFRDPVSSALWVSSKSGNEFFAASTDGQIFWMDCRNMTQPMESLILDLSKGEDPNLYKSYGISTMEYEHSIPTKYLVGTEVGNVYVGNRKGKTLQEKLSPPFEAHFSPIKSIQRNPAFLKNFLTIGDWRAKIFSEDAKESSIIWTGYHKAEVTGGAWSPVKYGNFFTIRSDGILNAWDLIENQISPVNEFKTGSNPLKSIRVQEHGRYVAVGAANGKVYMIEYSENFVVPSKNEKAQLTAIFERESRREKLIEGCNREMRLKAAAKGAVEKEAKSLGDSLKEYNEQLVKEFFDNLVTLEKGGKIKVEKVVED